MENIIENCNDGSLITQKMLKLSAIAIGLVCIVVLVLDISNMLITYFDEDMRFEVNFDELKKIRNLKSVGKEQMDDEKLKNLLMESIKNYTDQLNYKQNLYYFTHNLTKHKYKGIWKTKQSFGELEEKEGVLKLYIFSK
jgi:hypothetical protein